MKTLKIFLIALLSLVLTNSALAKPTEVTLSVSDIEYLNSFSSFEELLNSFLALGMMTKEDLRDISIFLKSKNVNLKNKPAKVQLKNGKFMTGSIGWSYQQDGTYKTTAGRIIRVQNIKSIYQLYTTAYDALENRQSAFQFLMPQAHAAEFDEDGLSSTSAGGVVYDFLTRTAGSIIKPIAGAFLGGVGGVVDFVGWPIREFILKGQVECSSGQYLITQSFTKAKFNFNSGESLCKHEDQHSYGSKFVATHWVGLCKWSTAAMRYFKSVTEIKAEQVFVSNDELKRIYKNGKIPACDNKNARIVQNEMKSNAQALFIPNGKFIPLVTKEPLGGTQ